MPRGDGTGPMGMGSMTGRGAGFCAGHPVAGFMNPVPGFGMGMRHGGGRGCGLGRGRGRGAGRGFRHGAQAMAGAGWIGGDTGQAVAGAVPNAAPVVGEAEVLRARERALQDSLEAVRGRLSALDAESSAQTGNA